MSHRRLHILAALLCTGLWAGAVWLGHSSGHLRFLDRLELALSDARTLARGVKAPPDLVTIVEIDDAVVKLGGTYPLPRAEIAKIVEAIARLEPKVVAIDLLLIDKGPADGDAALAKSFAARPTRLCGAAVFRTPFSLPRKDDGPLARLPKADRFLLPLPAFADRCGKSASPMWRRARPARRGRFRCCSGHARDRIAVSASRRVRRDRPEADDRARPPAVRRPADRDRFRLCLADFLITARAAPFAPSAPQV